MKIFFDVVLSNFHFNKIDSNIDIDKKESDNILTKDFEKKNQNENDNAKYTIKINFAGFIKLKFVIVNSEVQVPSRSQLQSQSFVYETNYANNLDSKFMTFKCQKINWLRRKITVSKYQIDLFSLATGPSKFSLLLPSLSPTTSTLTTSGRSKSWQFQLKFECSFTQICRQMKHIIHIPLSQHTQKDKYTYTCSLISKETKKNDQKCEIYQFKNNAENNKNDIKNFEMNLDNKSILLLDKYLFEIKKDSTIIYSRKFMANYDPNNCEKYSPLNIESENIVESFQNGPIYHQMSPLSLATEEGIVHGHIFDNYPIPKIWAKFAQISIKKFSSCDGANEKVENERKFNQMVELLYLHFNQRINKIRLNGDKNKNNNNHNNNNDDDYKNTENINDYKIEMDNLNICLERLKIRFLVPVHPNQIMIQKI